MAITLFQDKKNCCGCGACMNACSRNAIAMKEDNCGFVFPQINPDLCIECGACLKACGYQNPPVRMKPSVCFAATAKSDELLRKSSSGGVFGVLASRVIEGGGVVYGAAMPLTDDGFYPGHMRIEHLEDISLLQGSKYVQSDTAFTFRQAEVDLQAGKNVLYSGTPCQIAGLKKYLGKHYDKLLTLEVICHGVPSGKLFRDFICFQESISRKQIKGFQFRTKGKTSGKHICIQYNGIEGHHTEQFLPAYKASYMHYFQKNSLSRESCYQCPFASGERVADLTVGDFWGFYQEHPEISAKTQLGKGKGVSCILVNSEKGLMAVRECEALFALAETQFEKVARHNEQLCHPCKCSKERGTLVQMYREGGYSALENHFWCIYRKERFVQSIISMVPQGVSLTIKRMIGRLKQRITK